MQYFRIICLTVLLTYTVVNGASTNSKRDADEQLNKVVCFILNYTFQNALIFIDCF